MEVKTSSSKDVTAEKRQQPPSTNGCAAVHHPCTFLHQALTALLNCLGFETRQNPSNKPAALSNGCSSLPDGGDAPDPPTTSTGTTSDDPPSTTVQVGDPVVTVAGVPQRPDLSTGGGGKIN